MEKKIKKVLFGEDLRQIVDNHPAVFGRGKIEVFTAGTAEDAFETHRKEKVDFILADLDMPEMGGDSLCSAIRKDDDLKRVYITLVCSGKKADIARCGNCGANNYIKRPVKGDEVVERIVRIFNLNARRAERVLIKVSVKGNYNNESFFCTSRDISATGIFFETDKVLARNDRIACSFFLPDLDRIFAEGKIVRIAKTETEAKTAYGVDFTKISLDSRKTIEEFVNRNLQEDEAAEQG